MDADERAKLERMTHDMAKLMTTCAALLFAAVVLLAVYERVLGGEYNRTAAKLIFMCCLSGFCVIFGWLLGLMDVKNKLGGNV